MMLYTALPFCASLAGAVAVQKRELLSSLPMYSNSSVIAACTFPPARTFYVTVTITTPPPVNVVAQTGNTASPTSAQRMEDHGVSASLASSTADNDTLTTVTMSMTGGTSPEIPLPTTALKLYDGDFNMHGTAAKVVFTMASEVATSYLAANSVIPLYRLNRTHSDQTTSGTALGMGLPTGSNHVSAADAAAASLDIGSKVRMPYGVSSTPSPAPISLSTSAYPKTFESATSTTTIAFISTIYGPSSYHRFYTYVSASPVESVSISSTSTESTLTDTVLNDYTSSTLTESWSSTLPSVYAAEFSSATLSAPVVPSPVAYTSPVSSSPSSSFTSATIGDTILQLSAVVGASDSSTLTTTHTSTRTATPTPTDTSAHSTNSSSKASPTAVSETDNIPDSTSIIASPSPVAPWTYPYPSPSSDRGSSGAQAQGMRAADENRSAGGDGDGDGEQQSDTKSRTADKGPDKDEEADKGDKTDKSGCVFPYPGSEC